MTACAHPADDHPWVASLSIAGVHNVSRLKLEHGLVSKPTPWWKSGPAHRFEEAELDRDRLRVQRFYEQAGYYAAKVVLAEAKPRAASHAVDVRIAVEEGPPTYIGDVKVMGLGDVDGTTQAKVHKAQLGLRRGQVFHHADYEQFKTDIVALLVKHGFANAKVAGLVDVVPQQNMANITVTANPSGAPTAPGTAPDDAKPSGATDAPTSSAAQEQRR